MISLQLLTVDFGDLRILSDPLLEMFEVQSNRIGSPQRKIATSSLLLLLFNEVLDVLFHQIRANRRPSLL